MVFYIHTKYANQECPDAFSQKSNEIINIQPQKLHIKDNHPDNEIQ